MIMNYFSVSLLFTLALVNPTAYAHVAAFHKGMYCINGTKPGVENPNNNSPTVPMFKMKKEDWWMHHFDGCDELPPAPGDFLELPANGNFTVEMATNRAFTTLSFEGKKAGTFPGPLRHGLQDSKFGVTEEGQLPKCINDPNIHAQNESMASGTAFAISYESDIKKVTAENLVVFTVLHHTPWTRLATYQVPSLPVCPEGGCTCAWGWIPNGCGEPNMYMLPYKCNVTGTPGQVPLAPAKPAVWCEDQPGNCTLGAKQLIYWNQAEGDNIEVEGKDLSGSPRSPAYNEKLGFKQGAQLDIFLDTDPTIANNTATTATSTQTTISTVRTFSSLSAQTSLTPTTIRLTGAASATTAAVQARFVHNSANADYASLSLAVAFGLSGAVILLI